MRVSIRDVAERAGCSVSTVSLVLNNKAGKISPKTIARVREAAKDLRYRPNQLAVSLVKQRSLSIGLIVPDISNQFFSKLAKAVESICREHGFSVFLCNTNDDPRIESQHIRDLLDKSVDGLLLCMASAASYEDEARLIKRIQEHRVPYCVIDRHYSGIASFFVRVDHYRGALLAVEHLIAAGHRRIACVTGPPNLEDAQARLAGYRAALQAANLEFDEGLLFPGDYGWEKGRAAAEPVLASGATAVFAFNDLSAMGLMSGLHACGKSIPEDISVVGYDDSDYARIYDVPLSSIHQPLSKLGQEAFRLLLEQIEGQAAAETQVIIEPYLVERASVAHLDKNVEE